MSKRKNAKNIAYFCVILILVLVMLYSGLQILESTVFHSQQQDDAHVSKTIIRNGVEYFPRQDITVLMVLGIDRYGVVQSSGSYNNPGDSDMVALLVFDDVREVCDVLYLNRDTMLEIPVLGIGGKQAGTIFGQLALSHTYGSGLEDSCENVKNTLEAFLPGLTIDYYVSMHMDAISILNDSVGGVTVTVTDDFSDVDPSILMGSFTLKGEQAIQYVRTRKDVGDQKNVTRMERQQAYIRSFLDAFHKQVESSDSYLINTFEEVSPYIVTDCSTNTLIGLFDRYSDYAIGEFITPEGENIMGDQYYEFYADDEALDELILQLFYAEKMNKT